jgi:3-hydroxyacyl-[acyl-carrier-protein] dehydratase
MLKNELYKINSIAHNEGIIEASLEINKNNELFKGHFPGHPVLPGACMLQIVKEVLEGSLNKSVQLKKADYIKFLLIVDPARNNILQIKLIYKITDNNNILVTASLVAENDICFKFHGLFIAL